MVRGIEKQKIRKWSVKAMGRAGVWAAVVLALGLGLGNGGGNGMMQEANAKTYAQIAETFEQFGVTGANEEMLASLEEGYAELPPEVIFSKEGNLLSVLGMGEFDPNDIWLWEPGKNGVYSFDVEVFDEQRMYTNFLRGVSALDSEALCFENIREDTSGMNEEEGTGTRTVSFDWHGQTFELEANVYGDWFDLGVADALNAIIKARETGKQLYFTSDGYQECVVFYREPEWAEAFQRATGVELSPMCEASEE